MLFRSDGGEPVRTWTFAGTRENRTLARRVSTSGSKVRFDALSIQAPVGELATAPLEALILTPEELETFKESIKFADGVPQVLLSSTIVARNFDLDHGYYGHADP